MSAPTPIPGGHRVSAVKQARMAAFEHTRRRVLELYAQRMPPTLIAQTVGCYPATVTGILRQAGKLSAPPCAAKTPHQSREPEPVEVPKWVPPHLVQTYLAVAEREGEEAAASACRRLKQATA